MIKNIVFDMGNVLVDYNARRFVTGPVTDPTDATLLLQNIFASVEWVQLDRGSIPLAQAESIICERLPERLRGAAHQLLTGWYHGMEPYPEVEALCGQLQQAGYRLWLLSNAGVQFHKYSHTIGALRYFSGTLISADCGLLKPDTAIFDYFCSLFGLTAAECLFVDDFALNIEGAQRAGMQGLVYHGDAALLRAQLAAAGISLPV